MTTEAQKLALLEWAGWTDIHWYEDNAGPPLHCGKPPKDFKETFKKEHTYGCQLPNLSSLDTIAEFEKKLLEASDRGWREYVNELQKITCNVYDGDIRYWNMLHATAPQRLEALVRTLGLWRE